MKAKIIILFIQEISRQQFLQHFFAQDLVVQYQQFFHEFQNRTYFQAQESTLETLQEIHRHLFLDRNLHALRVAMQTIKETDASYVDVNILERNFRTPKWRSISNQIRREQEAIQAGRTAEERRATLTKSYDTWATAIMGFRQNIIASIQGGKELNLTALSERWETLEKQRPAEAIAGLRRADVLLSNLENFLNSISEYRSYHRRRRESAKRLSAPKKKLNLPSRRQFLWGLGGLGVLSGIGGPFWYWYKTTRDYGTYDVPYFVAAGSPDNLDDESGRYTQLVQNTDLSSLSEDFFNSFNASENNLLGYNVREYISVLALLTRILDDKNLSEEKKQEAKHVLTQELEKLDAAEKRVLKLVEKARSFRIQFRSKYALLPAHPKEGDFTMAVITALQLSNTGTFSRDESAHAFYSVLVRAYAVLNHKYPSPEFKNKAAKYEERMNQTGTASVVHHGFKESLRPITTRFTSTTNTPFSRR